MGEMTASGNGSRPRMSLMFHLSSTLNRPVLF
jgi:hypothetical protein